MNVLILMGSPRLHGNTAELCPFATGVRRLCEHSELQYRGLYSVQDTDNLDSFRTPEAVSGAREFARQLLL